MSSDDQTRLRAPTSKQVTVQKSTHGVVFAFSRNGQFLVAGDRLFNCVVWNLVTGRAILGPRRLIEDVCQEPALAFPTVRPVFIAVTVAGVHPVHSLLRMWDIRTGEDHTALKEPLSLFEQFAISHDGRKIALATAVRSVAEPDGSVEVWDIVGGRRIAHMMTGDPDYNPLAFSPDDNSLVTVNGGHEFEATTWNLLTDVKKSSFKGKMDSRIFRVEISPDNAYLLAEIRNGEIAVWDMSTGVRRQQSPQADKPSKHVGEIVFSPVGTFYATYRKVDDTEVVLRDWASGRVISRLEGQTVAVFSPDGRILATAGIDHSLTLWDVSPAK